MLSKMIELKCEHKLYVRIKRKRRVEDVRQIQRIIDKVLSIVAEKGWMEKTLEIGSLGGLVLPC